MKQLRKLIDILGYSKEDLKNRKLNDIEERVKAKGIK